MHQREERPEHDESQRRRRRVKSRRRYSDEFLRRLRNEIPIRSVIETLSIPHKYRDGYFRFLCPVCEWPTRSLPIRWPSPIRLD